MIPFRLRSSVLIGNSIDTIHYDVNKAYYIAMHTGGNRRLRKERSKETFVRSCLVVTPGEYETGVSNTLVIMLSTDMNRKEGVAAPLLTYCKNYVVILESCRLFSPSVEKKKTLMVSKSLLI